MGPSVVATGGLSTGTAKHVASSAVAGNSGAWAQLQRHQQGQSAGFEPFEDEGRLVCTTPVLARAIATASADVLRSTASVAPSRTSSDATRTGSNALSSSSARPTQRRTVCGIEPQDRKRTAS